MTIVTLASGEEINTSGGLRILELRERYYVVGQDLLIPLNSKEEAREEIRKLKGLECWRPPQSAPGGQYRVLKKTETMIGITKKPIQKE